MANDPCLSNDSTGTCVASYTCGEHTVTNYTTANIGNINPFRYRGYYFDTETGFYYLNARYYDPQTKRFLSADHINYLGANGDINAFNLFDIVGIELQLEAIGAGAKTSIGDWEFGINVNLAGATSITLAVNEDLGDDYTETAGFTMGVNTGLGVSIIATLCKGVYTGDFSPIIVPCP